MSLRIITVRQPWAYCLAVGVKLVENRGRRIADKHIDTTIGIHAGLNWCKVGANDPRVKETLRPYLTPLQMRYPLQPRDLDGLLAFGAIVSVGKLADCHPAAYGGAPGRTCCEEGWGEAEHNGGPCFHNEFEGMLRLPKPVRATGSLAVPWTVSADIEAQVLAQLPAGVA